MNLGLLDASAAGSLANAALLDRDRPETVSVSSPFEERPCAARLAFPKPCQTVWRRWTHWVFDLVSGPTFDSVRDAR